MIIRMYGEKASSSTPWWSLYAALWSLSVQSENYSLHSLRITIQSHSLTQKSLMVTPCTASCTQDDLYAEWSPKFAGSDHQYVLRVIIKLQSEWSPGCTEKDHEAVFPDKHSIQPNDHSLNSLMNSDHQGLQRVIIRLSTGWSLGCIEWSPEFTEWSSGCTENDHQAVQRLII